jgi:flavorubredoxin
MEKKHHHISPYLIRTPVGNILIEAGSLVHQDELKDRINRIVGDDSVSAAVVSHYDLPHAANVAEFRKEWGFELYTSFEGTSASPESLGMGTSHRCTHDADMEILDRRFNFPWPPLVDAAHSMWVYDYKSKTLFAADMGHYHRPGDCDKMWEESDDSLDNIKEYLEDALPFVKYLDSKKMEGAFEDLLNKYDIENIAPVHGTPIIGDRDVARYLEIYVDAIDAIRAESVAKK